MRFFPGIALVLIFEHSLQVPLPEVEPPDAEADAEALGVPSSCPRSLLLLLVLKTSKFLLMRRPVVVRQVHGSNILVCQYHTVGGEVELMSKT